MKFRIFLITSVMSIFACAIITPGGPQPGGTYTPKSGNDKVTQSVTAGQESTVQLSDSAQITIPENSLTGDSTVTIERNASKTTSLPPLGDMDLPLSDFYNFQVEGGQLAGPVDLIIPFNESKLPKQNGYLVAMIPTEQGWKYIPVETNGNKINLYTTELGDPLIAWHFICAPGDSEEVCKETKMKIHEDAAVCSPDIALSVVPETGTTETKYEFFGQLVPAKTKYLGVISRKPAGNVSVEITINQRAPGSGTTLNLVTDSNGKFNFILDASDNSSGLREDWNWLWAIANCDPWFGEIAVKSQGYVQFKISPEVVTPLPAEPPAAQTQPIAPPQSPTDKIPVPNVVGMTFEDAQATLENLGFNTTWIDGKSKLELGKIYSQAPSTGTLSVPHRTTVVPYRTTEIVTTPLECTQFNLTPEECANAGTHEYRTSFDESKYACPNGALEGGQEVGTFKFSNSSVTQGSEVFVKIGTNQYKQEVDVEGLHHTFTITFSKDGFILQCKLGPSCNQCCGYDEYAVLTEP